MTLTFLGTGTSTGVPTIGCECAVCRSTNPRDNRTRPSVLLRFNGRAVLIDAAPDFRAQALREKMDRLDAILFTHAHADHILGLDDVRVFNFRQKEPIPIYAGEPTLQSIQKTFHYVFNGMPYVGTIPKLNPQVLNGPLDLFGEEFRPVPVLHGELEVLGFAFRKAAYLTDFSRIPPESMEQLHGLDLLILDALRRKPHPTHSSLDQSVALVEELKPRQAYFTHICHDLPYEATNAALPENVALAYDGLQVEIK